MGGLLDMDGCEPEEKTRRQHIIDRLTDGISALLYYDRKEDEDLPRGEIERAILSGEITVKEMVEVWSTELRKGLEITSREIEKLEDYNYPPSWSNFI